MRVHCKAKKSAPKTTASQQSVIKAKLKLLTQNFFSAKLIYKCVKDEESYFTVDGNEWHQQTSLKITQQQVMSSSKFPAKVLLWLRDVSESGISELVILKAGLAINKEVYISKCLQVLKQTNRVLA
jgi:hypothetical protein